MPNYSSSHRPARSDRTIGETIRGLLATEAAMEEIRLPGVAPYLRHATVDQLRSAITDDHVDLWELARAVVDNRMSLAAAILLGGSEPELRRLAVVFERVVSSKSPEASSCR